jgi:multimeric flavodoxin WrbA
VKILALIGSPRVNGNTDLLVDQVLEGAKAKGIVTEKLYLYDFVISVCADCRSCKRGDCVCCLNDDMEKIYPLMIEADVIVFGTPVYWYGPSGKMKLLIDRMRPFVENKKLIGKRVVVVSPSAEGPVACGPMLEMFSGMFKYLKMEFVGKVLVKAYEYGIIAENKDELDRAFELGASL